MRKSFVARATFNTPTTYFASLQPNIREIAECLPYCTKDFLKRSQSKKRWAEEHYSFGVLNHLSPRDWQGEIGTIERYGEPTPSIFELSKEVCLGHAQTNLIVLRTIGNCRLEAMIHPTRDSDVSPPDPLFLCEVAASFFISFDLDGLGFGFGAGVCTAICVA